MGIVNKRDCFAHLCAVGADEDGARDDFSFNSANDLEDRQEVFSHSVTPFALLRLIQPASYTTSLYATLLLPFIPCSIRATTKNEMLNQQQLSALLGRLTW